MAPSRRTTKAKTHVLKNTDLRTIIEPADPDEVAFTATKVVVTIGPACRDVDTLCRILDAGATCARLDLTWGSLDFHKKSLSNLAEAMRKTRKLCAIVVDTIGRELIVNRPTTDEEDGWPKFEKGISVKANDTVILTTKEGATLSGNTLPVSYPKFTSMVQKGDTIFLGRYLVTGSEESSCYLTVEEVGKEDVSCTARNSADLDGLLTVFHTERSANTLQNVQNDLPILSDYDKKALKALLSHFEIDFVSLSFVREADDVHAAREFLDSIGHTATKLMAKCETRQSLFNFQSIAQASDAIIMSRGNLGLDVLPEKMALVQKAVISNSNLIGKPVLITRVVDTMVNTPRPTRAEATDVANAVLDGVDGILLGAETLRGKYPVQTVQTILAICRQAEKAFDHNYHFEHLMSHTGAPLLSKLESIASSAVRAADKVGAKLIIVYTQSGQTASLVSKYRPPMPILTLVIPQLKNDGMRFQLVGRGVARQCQIQRGLLPVLAAPSPSGETLLHEAVQMSLRVGLVNPNDHIVVVQMISDAFVVKILSVDELGGGIKAIRPKSLMDMMKVNTLWAEQQQCSLPFLH
ncbi:pyruvate kinase [Coccomyxa subellipsoidea C-169]|uniref:Pyruvate kinase n=1 Tax=Coccomyxa subellipsoidea (strain C-169) TaxID=574566 RepID=I0YYQ8_COCSC|nr:pyruvate kinase [Coccomyxa subellipsoidea C-169]EIE23527.1 pyruvate kinase [Coccomyxa subellipsoidea C-169]|eukprot:XP_005648071.1 pyruvate kinase [Coccomyxa subellipsoidea C-169]